MDWFLINKDQWFLSNYKTIEQKCDELIKQSQEGKIENGEFWHRAEKLYQSVGL